MIAAAPSLAGLSTVECADLACQKRKHFYRPLKMLKNALEKLQDANRDLPTDSKMRIAYIHPDAEGREKMPKPGFIPQSAMRQTYSANVDMKYAQYKLRT